MKNNPLEQQLETIVSTILSTKPVQPSIIRQHIAQYARDAGLPYSLVKTTAILKAKELLLKKIESL